MTRQNRLITPPGGMATVALEQLYEYPETRELVTLVTEAAELVHTRGEDGFAELRAPESRWNADERYVFVLDAEGNMLVHQDHALVGRNQLELKDVDGRPIVRGLIDAAMAIPGKTAGWYHYRWPVPGGLLPRWKSSFVEMVVAPSGKRYIVGSGMYDDRMERAFVTDLVTNAVGEIEIRGRNAFPLFQDPTGPFFVKDAYVFVADMNGVELANPGFPTLVGRNLLDTKDTLGKPLIREMVQMVRNQGSGWVDYMWPKPGQSVSTRKSTYVSGAPLGGETVVVGCGVYLADAPRVVRVKPTITAPELMKLVRDAATLLEHQGQNAYPELRKPGSKWRHDDTYMFVWTAEGTRTFHAADPALEGQHAIGLLDAVGRPYGRMIVEAGALPPGEGWVHYMYPEPGGIFPTWKSTFVKRVTFPSGKQHLVACGIYNMQMDTRFVEDVVHRAAALIAQRGKAAFSQLRDRKGAFVFMDSYVFVDAPDGTELVNPAQPSLEGKNLLSLRDLKGKAMVKEGIDAALNEGSAWIEYYWYKPGDNVPALKRSFVKRVDVADEVYIVGSGIYVE